MFACQKRVVVKRPAELHLKDRLWHSFRDAYTGCHQWIIYDTLETATFGGIAAAYGAARLDAPRLPRGALALAALLSLWFTRRLPTESLAGADV